MPIVNPSEFKRAVQPMVAAGATATVLVKVVKMARDPNSDLASICELLKSDGLLVGDIIRISNSFFYASGTPHTNLQSAVNYIGLREVIRVVNLSLSRQMFARDLPSYGLTAREFWSSSVAAALLMEALAKQAAGIDADDAYTIGIIHSVGKVLIDRIIMEKAPDLKWNGVQPVEEWERETVGHDFAEAGSMVADRWLFPFQTCDVIHCQLNPEMAVVPVSLLGALQFTRRMLALTGNEFENKGWQLPENDPYVKAAGLKQAGMEQMIAECEESYKQTRQAVEA